MYVTVDKATHCGAVARKPCAYACTIPHTHVANGAARIPLPSSFRVQVPSTRRRYDLTARLGVGAGQQSPRRRYRRPSHSLIYKVPSTRRRYVCRPCVGVGAGQHSPRRRYRRTWHSLIFNKSRRSGVGMVYRNG
jgi:hypothetical protein